MSGQIKAEFAQHMAGMPYLVESIMLQGTLDTLHTGQKQADN